ncbi:MAG: DUF531 family protein [Theionarchaea archaeon]|nr:DUF531 family protein [Theionarchaea archaeon]
MFLCLYNSYDKLNLHDIHTRSVARATPVCYALDFTLVLLDFPHPMYDHVVASTTIGKEGSYLRKLKDMNHYMELKGKLPLATLVVTTSSPDETKEISCQGLVDLSTRGKRLAFIIGLGRRGIPKSLRSKAHYHWDATGRGISLETCTAIGYIASRFTTALEYGHS